MGAFNHGLHRQDPLLHGFVVSNQQSGAGCLRFPEKTLKHVSNYLYSLNRMYLTRKKIQNIDQEKVSTVFKEKFEVFECEHPVPTKVSKKEKIQFLFFFIWVYKK